MFARRLQPSNEHFFPQIWLLTVTVVAFAAYVAVEQSYLQMMLAADRSHLSLLIGLIFLGASCHAAWHIFAVSDRLRGAEAMLRQEAQPSNGGEASASFLGGFLKDLHDGEAAAAGRDNDSVIEIYADRLRSPVEIGWFIVDVLIRLGLVGTIVGFILMLSSLAEGPTPDPDDIRTLLISMSGGMGTALYTTLSGLVGATLLGIQYMILSRGVEHLIGALIRIERRTAARRA